MASPIGRRALLGLQSNRAAQICCRRPIHSSAIVRKKKSQVIIEDLFGDGAAEDLIKPEALPSSPAAQHSSVASSSSSATAESSAPQKKKHKLTPEARLERFNQMSEYITPRLGRKPAVKTPGVRKSAWVNMVGLATSEEQLTQITGMLPGWKESGHIFDAQFSEHFVRRCEELSCPLLALKVFGDYSKYNLNLTLPGAQRLLHSLHVEYPIDHVITASALYRVYSLPPIAQDLVSCAMLVSACFKHGSKDSLRVATALIPHLEQLIKAQKPLKVSGNPTEKALDKPRVWLKWSLKKIDKAIFTQTGARADWLSVWRSKSGHIAEPSQF